MLPPPQPKISVIIPVYNVEEYLEECLESICNQTFKDIEIICVDDYSTDGSRAILERFAERDSRIRILDSTQKGVSFARNTGLDNARAEYIQFIDSDDYILPTMLETMYKTMCEHDVDAVVCGIVPLYEKGQEYRNKEHLNAYFERKNKHGKYEINRDILEYVTISLVIMLIKKSLLDDYSIRCIKYRLCEDQYVTRAYLSVSKNIFCLSDRFYYRRFHNDSIMDNIEKGDPRHIDFFYQTEEYFRFLHKHNLFEKHALYFWKYYISAIYTVMGTLERKDFPRLVNKVDKFILKYHHTMPEDDELAHSKVLLLHYLGYVSFA